MMALSKALLRVAAVTCLASPSLGADTYTLPPYSPAYEPRTLDERGLWMEADVHEKRLAGSPMRIRDDHLSQYVRDVLCRTVGSDRCGGVRVYIVDIPAFNATMMPNGAMSVWSGLLLRVRSEAELGAVLGHEFAHFELRHSLLGFQNRRSNSDLAAWIQVLGAIAQRDVSDTQLSIVGSVYRFNREQEKQADLLGLKYLKSSPYPSRSASEVWQHLMEEADATAAGRMIRKKHQYSAGFFDTHPTELNRADYLLEEALKFNDPGEAGAKEHYKAVEKYLPRFLSSQIRLNDFGGTEYIVSGIAGHTGWTGALLQARADMYVSRGNVRDLITATTLYLNAIDSGYQRPEIYRGLGLGLIKLGRNDDGRKYLKLYLENVPDAQDKKMIQLYIDDAGGE